MDRDAAKAFIEAGATSTNIKKFLLISYVSFSTPSDGLVLSLFARLHLVEIVRLGGMTKTGLLHKKLIMR